MSRYATLSKDRLSANFEGSVGRGRDKVSTTTRIRIRISSGLTSPNSYRC
jgi:hypothetical protein